MKIQRCTKHTDCTAVARWKYSDGEYVVSSEGSMPHADVEAPLTWSEDKSQKKEAAAVKLQVSCTCCACACCVCSFMSACCPRCLTICLTDCLPA